MRFPWIVAAGIALGGCSTSPAAPHGSPVLLDVYWIVGGQRTLVWAASPDGGATAPSVAPAGQQVDFVFDRRLDGSKIEDTTVQNGVTVQIPKATPPIAVSWASGVDSTPPFADQVFYNTEPFYGGATSFVFLRPATAGFPASSAIVFALDKTALTSAYNEPMIGPDQITVMTGEFTANVRTLATGDAGSTVPTSFMIPVDFSNRVAADAVAPFIHADSAAGPIPVTVSADASDPTIVYVTAGCPGGWPTTGLITVTVDAGAPDSFGAPLAASTSGSFTAVGAGAASDGGC